MQQRCQVILGERAERAAEAIVTRRAGASVACDAAEVETVTDLLRNALARRGWHCTRREIGRLVTFVSTSDPPSYPTELSDPAPARRAKKRARKLSTATKETENADTE